MWLPIIVAHTPSPYTQTPILDDRVFVDVDLISVCIFWIFEVEHNDQVSIQHDTASIYVLLLVWALRVTLCYQLL